MTNRLILPVSIVCLAAAPLAAQQTDERARLDDFAIPVEQDANNTRIDQLGDRGSAVVPSASQSARDLTAPDAGKPAKPASGPMRQVSSSDTRTDGEQLVDPSRSRETAAASVSSAADSRPDGAGAIQGSDRCDPSPEVERDARCAAILETRAAEFDAVEPPRLSAEQVLLAGQGDRADVLSSYSSEWRVALARDNPDADTRSTQELASLVFDQNPGALTNSADPVPEAPAELTAILEALQIDLPPSTGQ
ncbi:hypothetical protein [Aurantiacibacter spongiae]|uniref:Secreted protein n=1 Tax=Aurantiacibacter spongiae TaxID=2488860 RepID=A0A3N5DGZ5_9SPHN|nr:hypothetical protein [Aurantiacibacter spongiae]RPF70942.1 hypothetical protein EG799_04400 [Aurantiacibacter spongiae]